MLKVLIYPADKRLVNDTPYLFHPKGLYRIVVILGFGEKTKIYTVTTNIPYDLLPGNKLDITFYDSWRWFPDRSNTNRRWLERQFREEFTHFITEHIKRMVELKRKSQSLFTHEEIDHLGYDRIRRDRRNLAKDLRHWQNVSNNLNGSERTRAFGRQMALLVQGQLNHYDTFIGQEWNEVIRAVDGVIVF